MQLAHVGRKKRLAPFDIVNYLFMAILSALFLYPLIQTLAISLSDPIEMIGKNITVWPIGFSLDSYKILLSDKTILRYYLNTILYTGSGTLVALLACSMLAYPLTFPHFRGRKVLSTLLIITMFFSGGMIPAYVNIMNLKMLNTIWAIILPGAVSAYNVILFRTFFMNIPDSLRESACIDGAGHLRVFFSIILPLSKAVIATVGLFVAVNFWNSYMDALIYLDEQKKMPIQMFLRRILVEMETDYSKRLDMERILQQTTSNPRTVKAGATVITILPIMCVYPFVQKYFAKGVMIGSIKA